MTTIGTFTKTADGRYQGALRTLTLNLKGVEIRPAPKPAYPREAQSAPWTSKAASSVPTNWCWLRDLIRTAVDEWKLSLDVTY